MGHFDVAGQALAIVVGRDTEVQAEVRLVASQVIIELVHVLDVLQALSVRLAVQLGHHASDLVIMQIVGEEDK